MHAKEYTNEVIVIKYQNILGMGKYYPCEYAESGLDHFKNSESYLNKRVPEAKRTRKDRGLDGLVGDLAGIIINVENENMKNAIEEMNKFTGYETKESYYERGKETVVLEEAGSADIILTARQVEKDNPFKKFNIAPKTINAENTRLETLVFEVTDIKKYVEIQKKYQIEFMTEEIETYETHDFIQTIPSSISGTSFGFIQWKKNKGTYRNGEIHNKDYVFEKKPEDPMIYIDELDHLSVRVHSEDRDNAIIEFMLLTNHDFDRAIYIEEFNSITNVLRKDKAKFAMVYTSGIVPYKNDKETGPTEKFIHNYGTRAHHLAFNTRKIENVYEALQKEGMTFMIELVGSRNDGLKQTFTYPSKNTFIVNEYIQRYDGFDGFFTKSNVSRLTDSTNKQ